MNITVAPTEPPALKALGKVSLLPERLGCDVVFWTRGKKCGVQRKEVKDFIASVGDGRLAKELGQMRAGNVAARLVIVEGKVAWTEEGVMIARFGQTWTRRQWAGIMWSVQEAGCWVMTTETLGQTIDAVTWFGEWCAKDHRSLLTRPGPTSMWGTTVNDAEWGAWMMQGFPGIGPGLAEEIVREFGRVPMTMSAEDEARLSTIKGMGVKRVAAIRRLLT